MSGYFTSAKADDELNDLMGSLKDLSIETEASIKSAELAKKNLDKLKDSSSSSKEIEAARVEAASKKADSDAKVSRFAASLKSVGSAHHMAPLKVLKKLSLFHDETEEFRLKKLFERSQTLDICFVIDATGSMSMEMLFKAARYQFVGVLQLLQSTNPTLVFRVALVAYRDVTDTTPFEVIPFTTDFNQFSTQLRGVKCGGGGDDCEDVIGGLVKAEELEWSSLQRLLFLCGDFPCHGSQYHDSACGDSYPTGVSGQQSARSVLLALKAKNVQLNFWKLTNHTDIMISRFNEEVGGQGDYITTQLLDVTNDAVMSDTLKSSLKNTISGSMAKSSAAFGKVSKRDIGRASKAVLPVIMEEASLPSSSSSKVSEPDLASVSGRSTGVKQVGREFLIEPALLTSDAFAAHASAVF